MSFKRLFLVAAAGTAVYLFATRRRKQEGDRLSRLGGDDAGRDSRPPTLAQKVRGTVADMLPGRGGARERQPIAPDTASAADDFALARKVEGTLTLNPHFQPGRVLVSADRGKITLRGTTDAGQYIRQFGESAAGVPGVSEVENLLHIQGSPPPTRHEGGLASESVNRAVMPGTS